MEDQTKPMCRSGCGFYGNPATNGLCSLCYKVWLSKIQSRASLRSSSSCSGQGIAFPEVKAIDSSTPGVMLDNKVEGPHMNFLLSEGTKSAASNTTSESDAVKELTEEHTNEEKAVRCAVESCRRKLGLTDLQCRCGGHFCATHRYSDRHNCTFDYRAFGAREIRRKNPKVVGEKIQKI